MEDTVYSFSAALAALVRTALIGAFAIGAVPAFKNEPVPLHVFGGGRAERVALRQNLETKPSYVFRGSGKDIVVPRPAVYEDELSSRDSIRQVLRGNGVGGRYSAENGTARANEGRAVLVSRREIESCREKRALHDALCSHPHILCRSIS